MPHWGTPNDGATNSSGFTGLGGGLTIGFFESNDFTSQPYYAYFWSSTEWDLDHVRERHLWYNGHGLYSNYIGAKTRGFSVRCIKD